MKRSELTSLPTYFDRYILKCDDNELLEVLETSIQELDNLPVDAWERIGDKTYAEGKWTIKDILQHLIDTERVFAYRALAFSRGQREVKVFDEDTFARLANANQRSLADLIDELRVSHHSLLMLFRSFSEEHLERTGEGFKGPYSVASIGFCMAGHQRWHMDIIREKYLPLA